MMSELKPCPFCGGTDLNVINNQSYAVQCLTCNGRARHFFTEEEAIVAWNHRPLSKRLKPSEVTEAGFYWLWEAAEAETPRWVVVEVERSAVYDELRVYWAGYSGSAPVWSFLESKTRFIGPLVAPELEEEK